MAIALNTVIVDGQEYKPGDVIPDFKSIKCVDTREPRKYQGLSADVSVLNDVIAKYASGGASCFMSDTGEYYEYDRKEKTWKLITNITERGFDSEKAYGALKHMLNLKNEVIDTSVKSWLDNHPEAATTVQDHSLGINKIIIGVLGYIKPEMFGAKGDGVTDDTDALKKTFNYVNSVRTKIVLSGKYLITDTIIITSAGFVCEGAGSQVHIYNNSDNYAFKILQGNLTLQNFTLHSKYGIQISDNNIRVGSTKIENVIFEDVDTAIYIPNSCGYNYFEKVSTNNTTGSNPIIVLGGGDPVNGVGINYLYFDNCNIQAKGKTVVKIYNCIYAVFDKCDFTDAECVLKTEYLNAIENLYFINSTFYRNKKSIEIDRANNLNFINCVFNMESNAENIIGNIGNNFNKNKIVNFNNCYTMLHTSLYSNMPNPLLVITNVDDCNVDIKDQYSFYMKNALKLQDVTKIHYENVFEHFTIPAEKAVRYTFGNDKNMKPLRDTFIPLFADNTENTVSVSEVTTEDNGKKSIVLTGDKIERTGIIVG